MIFRHQIQPWHPSSTLVHEAALAVGLIAPEGFWDYSKALFDCQETYFDVCENRKFRKLLTLFSLEWGADGLMLGKLGKLNKKRMKGSVMNETRNQVKWSPPLIPSICDYSKKRPPKERSFNANLVYISRHTKGSLILLLPLPAFLLTRYSQCYKSPPGLKTVGIRSQTTWRFRSRRQGKGQSM